MVAAVLRGRIQRGRSRSTGEDIAHNPNQIIVSCVRPSILGNPFKIGEDGDRDFFVRSYALYLSLCLSLSPDQGNARDLAIKQRLEYLRQQHLAGKEIVLLCYCECSQACHTDVIKEYIETGVLE